MKIITLGYDVEVVDVVIDPKRLAQSAHRTRLSENTAKVCINRGEGAHSLFRDAQKMEKECPGPAVEGYACHVPKGTSRVRSEGIRIYSEEEQPLTGLFYPARESDLKASPSPEKRISQHAASFIPPGDPPSLSKLSRLNPPRYKKSNRYTLKKYDPKSAFSDSVCVFDAWPWAVLDLADFPTYLKDVPLVTILRKGKKEKKDWNTKWLHSKCIAITGTDTLNQMGLGRTSLGSSWTSLREATRNAYKSFNSLGALVVLNSSAGAVLAWKAGSKTNVTVIGWQGTTPGREPWQTPPGRILPWFTYAYLISIAWARATHPSASAKSGVRDWLSDGLQRALTTQRVYLTQGIQVETDGAFGSLTSAIYKCKELELIGPKFPDEKLKDLGEIPTGVLSAKNKAIETLAEFWVAERNTATSNKPPQPSWSWETRSYGNNFTAATHQEIDQLEQIHNLIRAHGIQRAKKPLSILVLGRPGSGKSFAVKSIANLAIGRDQIEIIEANVAQANSEDELHAVFERGRSAQLRDKRPVIFFDEFDATRSALPLGWIRSFLGPMQDASYWVPHGEVVIGSPIIVFAGGTKPTLSEFRRQPDRVQAKIPDFLSRVACCLEVPSINQSGKDSTWAARRALLIHTLVKEKWPKLEWIDRSVLEHLMTVKLKYEVRSLEQIIQRSSLLGERRYTSAAFPEAGLLKIHIEDWR